MKCKKVQGLLPLLVSSDLQTKESEKIKTHLKSCPRCKSEYESYLLTFKKTREWLDKNRIDWQEKEWKSMVEKAVQREESVPAFRLRWQQKKAWAYMVIAGAAVIISLFVLRFSFFKSKLTVEKKVEKSASTTLQQESVSLTMVSRETGLKIVWFFNKNFELKEEK